MNPEDDERITAWDCIARHPFFSTAFEKDGALIDSMIELLDKAVSLPSKGENMNYTSTPDFDGDYVQAVKFDHDEVRNGIQLIAYNAYSDRNNSVILTLKDVADLHKALGDHLEANKRELPREGAVRFSGGQIAVYVPTSLNWLASDGLEYNSEELVSYFGTDWEELVVK